MYITQTRKMEICVGIERWIGVTNSSKAGPQVSQRDFFVPSFWNEPTKDGRRKYTDARADNREQTTKPTDHGPRKRHSFAACDGGSTALLGRDYRAWPDPIHPLLFSSVVVEASPTRDKFNGIVMRVRCAG